MMRFLAQEAGALLILPFQSPTALRLTGLALGRSKNPTSPSIACSCGAAFVAVGFLDRERKFQTVQAIGVKRSLTLRA